MKPFFHDARLKKLEAESASWVGTPFLQNGTRKGVGVSCHYLVAEILFSCGIPRVDVPQGSARWGNVPSEESILEEGFDGAEHFQAFAGVEIPDLIPGDVLGFRVGNKIHHVGLMLAGGNFIHCLRKVGVQITTIHDEKFTSRLVKIWRAEEWE